jgi:hypothetical protein
MQAQQPQQQGPPPAVLVFLKSLATPLVLYTPNVQETFADIKDAMKNAKPASPKLIEKETLGPLKVVFFWDTEIAGAALQMDMGQASPPPPPASATSRLPLNPLNKGGLMPPPSPPSSPLKK